MHGDALCLIQRFTLRHVAAMLNQGILPGLECVAVTYNTWSSMIEWARGARPPCCVLCSIRRLTCSKIDSSLRRSHARNAAQDSANLSSW